MSRDERYGTRDLAFSRWHRAIPRDDLTWIDIDHCAYCNTCKATLYLMELAQDVGQPFKATTITRRLANDLNIKALLVLYRVNADGDIERFRVRRIAPDFTDWAIVGPDVLRRWIEREHDKHSCSVEKAA